MASDIAMEAMRDDFQDLNNEIVYKEVIDQTRRDSTTNFVVHFGTHESQIAFNTCTM